MSEILTSDRRTFLRRGAMGAGAFWMLSLAEFAAREAYGQSVAKGPYGPVTPKHDETTGLPLIQLPDGFRYYSYSWTGDLMSDGVACPNLHDGMAAIGEWHGNDDEIGGEGRCEADPYLDHHHDPHDGDRGREADRGSSDRLVLVRNHEGAGGTPYLNNGAITYAADAKGGTTNLVFDAKRGEWLEAWSSLAGTWRNCAGAVTPWGTWISCEEVGDLPNHGWNFEVGLVKGSPKPLKDMGRFSHEAGMVDPRTGCVYQTEDSGSAGFYKFVPYDRGRLSAGELYMLRVKNAPNLDLGADHASGTRWDVAWVRIDDPQALVKSVFAQGSARGGARFARLEGAWWGDRTGYFLSTRGGSSGKGQVFEYDPRREAVTLIYSVPDASTVSSPDNLTVSPRGGLLLCEDAAGSGLTEGERLIGLTLDGRAFTFAQNNIVLSTDYNGRVRAGDYRRNQWAGACYSPDGKWLFVNIQKPGVTLAITGPWGCEGPL
jgi:secreted PhoX family phosphatase